VVTICPTITAFDPQEYRRQIENVQGFARRIHIDLMDGEFAPTKSPELKEVWWPHELIADIHLMYQRPMDYLEQLIKLKPHMVVVHNEASVHHMHFSAELHKHGIKTGLAILQETPIEWAEQIMHSFDQVLIFSGHLGHHGGEADLGLLEKVTFAKSHHPEVEVAWDGGINEDNITKLVKAGVDILNVGGFVQKADNPVAAYAKLSSVIADYREQQKTND
jgi:ribulose-phosphate 3-epimerase